MTHFRYLSFLTDYGLEDGFVAACRGVAARIAPDADIIDVTHLIPPGDVRRGAAVLAQTVPYLPPAVHVAVVDPGVGTGRRGIAVAAGDSVFVGPDNGLLSWALTAAGGAARAFSLTNRELWLSQVTHTFHGRDIFMPVAAHLAAGAGLDAAGPEIDVADLVMLPAPERVVRDSVAAGEVLTVDRFGNVQLTITGADAAEIGVEPGGTVLVQVGHRQLALPYRDTFGAVPTGELVAYTDSAGLVSVAVNGGNAAQRLGLPPGARISIAAVSKLLTHDAFRDRRPHGTITTGRVGTSPPQAARPVSEEISDQVSHRSFRSTLVPVASGLAAVIAVSWAAPAQAATGYSDAGRGVQAQEWWLGGLHVTQAWRHTEGAGVTVAVLGTGVDARHPDLAGSVTTGPDYSGSGRTAGGPFWGVNGTAVAGVIAGHGHGTGRADGIIGVAPAARILSVRVSLEYNDPLNSDQAIARWLPGAIASGIIYAVDHGARVIDLPLDPGTAGLTGQGSLAAAGGSPAERTAVAYALRRNVVLVGPAGDDGQGPGLVDYPAAYPGVIAVGAVARDGQVAPFSSRRSYVALTAPGVRLAAATPPDGYAPVSSTSAASGIVAGVAALVISRFPHLTAAQVGQVLTGGATTARDAAPGAGRGIVDAARSVGLAESLTAASEPSRPAAAPASPHKPRRLSTSAAHATGAGDLAGSLVRYIVAGLGALIAVLVVLLLLMRRRREKARAAGPARRADWAAAGGWQGGGLGEMQPSQAEPFRPVITPPPKTPRSAAKTPADSAGPPWAPAPEPERIIGPLPAVANSALPPDPGPGIRVPGDMAALPAVPPDAVLPAPFDPGASPDPDFPPRPPAGDEAGPSGRPARQSLGFAAAPVPADYAPPQAPDFTVPSRAAGLVLSAGTRPSAPADPPGAPAPPGPEGPGGAAGPADPSYIWDLAATDVFPAADVPGPPTEAPGPVPEDGEPGASGR